MSPAASGDEAEAALRARLRAECPPAGAEVMALRATLVSAKRTCYERAGPALLAYQRTFTSGTPSGRAAEADDDIARVRAECGAIVAAVEAAAPSGDGCIYDALVLDPTAQIPAGAVVVALQAVGLEAVGRGRSGDVAGGARLMAHGLRVAAVMTRVDDPLGWAAYQDFVDWGPWLERWDAQLDDATRTDVTREIGLARAALLPSSAMFARALLYFALEAHATTRVDRGPAYVEGALRLVAAAERGDDAKARHAAARAAQHAHWDARPSSGAPAAEVADFVREGQILDAEAEISDWLRSAWSAPRRGLAALEHLEATLGREP
ncbi:MAG: hypothetical protein U1F43_18325 [Myxococcota bacterium]